MADMLRTIICVNLSHYTLAVNCSIGKCGITDILPWIIISISLMKWKWPWQLLLSSLLANGDVRGEKTAGYYGLYGINHLLKKAFANSSTLLLLVWMHQTEMVADVRLQFVCVSSVHPIRGETFRHFSAITDHPGDVTLPDLSWAPCSGWPGCCWSSLSLTGHQLASLGNIFQVRVAHV